MSTAGHQLVMLAALDDLPVVHHQQQIRLPDRREPVRHDEYRALLPQPIQRPQHRRFRLGIERGGRFVQIKIGEFFKNARASASR